MATKNWTRKIFTLPTMFTALIAAVPEEEIILVLMKLKLTKKNWSMTTGISRAKTKR